MKSLFTFLDVPIQEQFAFCFNTALSDLAAQLPQFRDHIVAAQIDALACSTSSLIELLNDSENVHHSKSKHNLNA